MPRPRYTPDRPPIFKLPGWGRYRFGETGRPTPIDRATIARTDSQNPTGYALVKLSILPSESLTRQIHIDMDSRTAAELAARILAALDPAEAASNPELANLADKIARQRTAE